MSHKFHIDNTIGLLKEAYIGSMSLNSLTEANDTILAHPEFRSGLNFLTDLRKAQIPFGYEEMNKHVLSLPSMQIARQAFIVSRDREYGMIRMFLTLTEDTGIFSDGAVFRSLEEGVKWLTS
jgi:hypothetical protein